MQYINNEEYIQIDTYKLQVVIKPPLGGLEVKMMERNKDFDKKRETALLR